MMEKPKLSEYRKWKTELKVESYLGDEDSAARRALTCLRGSAHALRVETGRWEFMTILGVRTRLERRERMCTVCFREVEDETHFMRRCPLYEASRVRLADELSRFGVSGEVSQYLVYLRSSDVSGVGVDEVKFIQL